jgi:rod shape-determining protein MreD
MGSSIYVAAPVMALLAVLQAAVLPHFPVVGVIPQLSFLVALSWGILRGPNEGAVWAFVAGLALDLFSAGPLGATALAFMGAVLAASGIARVLPENRLVMPLLLALVATPIYLLTYQLFLQLLGRGAGGSMPTTLVTLSLLHGGLFVPFHWLMLSVQRLIRPRPVTI